MKMKTAPFITKLNISKVKNTKQDLKKTTEKILQNKENIKEKSTLPFNLNDNYSIVFKTDELINLFNYNKPDEELYQEVENILSKILNHLKFTKAQEKLFDYCISLAREEGGSGGFYFDPKKATKDLGLKKEANNQRNIANRLLSIIEKKINLNFKTYKNHKVQIVNFKDIPLIIKLGELDIIEKIIKKTDTKGNTKEKIIKHFKFGRFTINPDLYKNTILNNYYALIETRAYKEKDEIYTLYKYVMEIARSQKSQIIKVSYFKLLEYNNLLKDVHTNKSRCLKEFNSHLTHLLNENYFKSIHIKQTGRKKKISLKKEWWKHETGLEENKILNRYIVYFELTDYFFKYLLENIKSFQAKLNKNKQLYAQNKT